MWIALIIVWLIVVIILSARACFALRRYQDEENRRIKDRPSSRFDKPKDQL